MPRTTAFDANTDQYDDWFVRHDGAYLSELAAVRRLLPRHGFGLEIGVGTARFAFPLGVPVGVDPSFNALCRARDRHVLTVCGIAEELPFVDRAFDYCLIVTTICFLDDTEAALREAGRVLKPNGELVVGLIDRESPLGHMYLSKQSESVFYRDATFYTARDVESLVVEAGFADVHWVQTLFKGTSDGSFVEQTRPGYGEGSFIVLKACLRTSSSNPPGKFDNAVQRPYRK